MYWMSRGRKQKEVWCQKKNQVSKSNAIQTLNLVSQRGGGGKTFLCVLFIFLYVLYTCVWLRRRGGVGVTAKLWQERSVCPPILNNSNQVTHSNKINVLLSKSGFFFFFFLKSDAFHSQRHKKCESSMVTGCQPNTQSDWTVAEEVELVTLSKPDFFFFFTGISGTALCSSVSSSPHFWHFYSLVIVLKIKLDVVSCCCSTFSLCQIKPTESSVRLSELPEICLQLVKNIYVIKLNSIIANTRFPWC